MSPVSPTGLGRRTLPDPVAAVVPAPHRYPRRGGHLLSHRRPLTPLDKLLAVTSIWVTLLDFGDRF